MIQVTVPIFFYFDEISKIKLLEPKNLDFSNRTIKNRGFRTLATLFSRFCQNKENLEHQLGQYVTTFVFEFY